MSNYDRLASEQIALIHMNAKISEMDRQYSTWVDNNLEHLENLHRLAGLDDVDPDVFYSYVYHNSHPYCDRKK
jgi:hypothetical protein